MLGAQAKFPTNVSLRHRKHYFANTKLQSNSQNHEHLKYIWKVYCVFNQSQQRSSNTKNECIASVTELWIHDRILLVFALFQDTPFVLT